MTERLALEIATPERLVLAVEADEVVLPSVEGSMGVLPGHAPLLATLDVGEISYRDGSARRHFAVCGGFAEVLRDGVRVLADICERAEEIDVERAKRARERAEERLRAQQADLDFARATAALERALNRLQVASRAGERR
jgi:F-type H+-transporting ATPase subunit epsilon